VLVFHRIQQGLAVRVAGEPGPGRRPHGAVLGGEVEVQLVAEYDQRSRAALRLAVVCSSSSRSRRSASWIAVISVQSARPLSWMAGGEGIRGSGRAGARVAVFVLLAAPRPGREVAAGRTVVLAASPEDSTLMGTFG
jgi:hypothetical protein